MRTQIEHVTLLTMDDESRVFSDGWVLFDEEQILAVGDNNHIRDVLPPADVKIDGRGGILMPGMVNVHSHIPMIPFRSMGDDCPDRLRRFLFPLELEAMTPELVYAASRYAVCELLLAGVTCVLDMYYFEDQVARACDELGIRGWLGETVIGQETCDSKKPYGGLALCEDFIKKWQDHERIHPIVAPHATNTNSPEMLRAAFDLAEKYKVLYTLHASEMDYEMSYFRDTYGKTPMAFLYDLGVLGEWTVAAHCIHVTGEDIRLMAETGTKAAHCIGSNTKAGKGIAPVLDMDKAGIAVGLGTDGPSSGNTLDLFTQFKMFACCQKTKYRDRSAFPAQRIVSLGTREGARVLGAHRQIGSIEPGKQADLVLLETASANMFPLYNPYSAIVYSANVSNVDSVWVQGRQLVGEKRLLHADLASERSRLSARMNRFQELALKYRDMI